MAEAQPAGRQSDVERHREHEIERGGESGPISAAVRRDQLQRRLAAELEQLLGDGHVAELVRFWFVDALGVVAGQGLVDDTLHVAERGTPSAEPPPDMQPGGVDDPRGIRARHRDAWPMVHTGLDGIPG